MSFRTYVAHRIVACSCSPMYRTTSSCPALEETRARMHESWKRSSTTMEKTPPCRLLTDPEVLETNEPIKNEQQPVCIGLSPRSVSPLADDKMIDKAPSIPKLNEIRTNPPRHDSRVSLAPRKQHHPSPTDPPRLNQPMSTYRKTEVDELSDIDEDIDMTDPAGTTPTGVDAPFESLGLPSFPSFDLDDQAFSRATSPPASPALPRTPRPPSFAIRPRPSRAQQPCAHIRM